MAIIMNGAMRRRIIVKSGWVHGEEVIEEVVEEQNTYARKNLCLENAVKVVAGLF